MRSHKFPLAVIVAITLGMPAGAMTLAACGVHPHHENVPAHTQTR